jgi:tetratricopeptide (TPR) repeat protein
VLLDDLATKYGTDKGIWGYLPHYTRELEHRRHEVTQVLEIGICGERDIPNNVTGASLWMWHDYFPGAHIHGIDIDPKWMIQADRISSYLGDQRSPESLRTIAAHGASFDLIVDDAIHDPDVQLVALRALLPFLKPDGLYVIEDVCPYKLPNNDISLMTSQVPAGFSCEVIRTHKPEVLLFIKAIKGDGVAKSEEAPMQVVETPSVTRASLQPTESAPQDRPLLGLVMIVKNEAKRIASVIASYRPFIDAWTILDTGSTDGTQDLIRGALDGVPGALHEEPFVDFATSRNRALELHGTATVFSIMPNGDVLSGGAALVSFLEAHRSDRAGAYRARISPGHYYHPLVMRCGAGWRYKWRTHECATGDNLGPQIPGVTVVRDRGSRTDAEWRQRWTRDLDLLNRDRADDPADPRPYFYLGQTHECLGQHAQALAFFERRTELGGYFDEVYEAKFRVAKMKAALDRPWSEVQDAYLAAHALDPRRAEPLHAIAEHWHNQEEHALTRLFAVPAADLPKPPTDLFLDEEVYRWRAADLAAVSSYYTGRKEAGRRLAEIAVRGNPDDERLRANRAYFALRADALFGATIRPIEFKPEPGWNASNPSIYRGHFGLRCIVRTVNYKIVDDKYVTPPQDIVSDGSRWQGWQLIRTRNFLLNLDDNFKTTRVVELIDKTGIDRTIYPVHGFEDARLFEWRGKWWATATVCDLTDDGRREIALLELDLDGAVVRAEPLRGHWSVQAQKNWMPIIDGDAAKFVYATSPSPVIFDLVEERGDHVIDPGRPVIPNHGRLRGGSQGARVDGGWLFVVHDVAFPGDGRLYLHRFVLLNEQLKLVSMSDPFYFERLGIEFCAGLAEVEGKLVASYAVNDGAARLAIFDWERVRGSLRADFVI